MTYKAYLLKVNKDHTVPHYQWIVGYDTHNGGIQHVCSLNECMLQDQPTNAAQAKRIAACLNACADLPDDTLAASPCGIASEWMDAWFREINRSSVPEQ